MRMERLELSKQKLLGPKSSASTNFATSAILVYAYTKMIRMKCKSLNLIIRFKNLFIYVYTINKTCCFSSKH